MRINAPEPERSTRWLLFRRSLTDKSDVAFFACGAPPETTFDELVEVAGKRWTIEECFETAKGDCGPFVGSAVLDRLAPPRDAGDVGLRRRQRRPFPGDQRSGSTIAVAVTTTNKRGAIMVRLSVSEVRSLLINVAWGRDANVEFALAWSHWRRRHQYFAKLAYHRRRGAKPPDDEVQLKD
jgi:hypothetical protein